MTKAGFRADIELGRKLTSLCFTSLASPSRVSTPFQSLPRNALPCLFCPFPLLPNAPFPGLSRVHPGLGAPRSLLLALPALGARGEQHGLMRQPKASGSGRVEGHIPRPPNAVKPQEPAAPHKGAAEKSQVGKVSDLMLNGSERHWLRLLLPAKPGAGPQAKDARGSELEMCQEWVAHGKASS